MSKAEFEEKSYESPLIAQLAGGSGPIFSPGQVLEGIIGFDQALKCLSAEYWGLVGRPAPAGVVLDRAWFPPHLPPPAAALPNFSLNLILQMKRPERMTRSTSAEWSHWGQKYFRYEIVPHQQAALAALSIGAGANAHVAYAAPAFHKNNELFASIQARSLVAQSNFADAAKITGHDRYTYTHPGITGIAHSEPAKLQSTPWVEIMPHLLDRSSARLKELEGENVFTLLGGAVETAIETNAKGLPDPKIFNQLVHTVIEAARPKDEHLATVKSFVLTNLFCLAIGATWLIAGSAKTARQG